MKELNCSDNKLISLNLSNCNQLEKIDCSDNLLTNITLPTSSTNLKSLDLKSNNFPVRDLSFLVSATNLEELGLGNGYLSRDKINHNIYNRFTGSLDYLSEMKKLKELDVRNIDINEVNIDKLPRSLKKIEYSTDFRPNCKLTKIVPLLEEFLKYGACQTCKRLNTKKNWCQPCVEKEWKEDIKSLTGQKLVEKFIEKRSTVGDLFGENKLQWIPYEEFTDISEKPIGEGGFSKIYKAGWNYQGVALKVLNNSQNITLDFLTEIANTKLVDEEEFGDDDNNSIVQCHGISQDPEGNYVMVMDFIEEGNLREYLRNSKLSFHDKLQQLSMIAQGLNYIHKQNLIHHDFHSGNILTRKSDNHQVLIYIADLGLCKLVDEKKKETVFGVLSYVAPEVLQEKPYTQASDIYSFGIVAYELLANVYPYYDELKNLSETTLAIRISRGHRPNVDELKIPQLLKGLIKRCWDTNPSKRPTTNELEKTLRSWQKETEFTRQLQEIEVEYNRMSQNTTYKSHPTAIMTSKLINTKLITRRLEKLKVSEEYHTSTLEELTVPEKSVGVSLQTQVEISSKK